MKVVRYIISGTSGAVVNLGSFFIFVHLLHLWYLIGSIFAFILAFFVSFTLQRFWTFEHRSRADLGRHALLYLVVALGNLALNTLLVYILVDKVSVAPLIAQLIGGIVVSGTSYFIYKHLVFHPTSL